MGSQGFLSPLLSSHLHAATRGTSLAHCESAQQGGGLGQPRLPWVCWLTLHGKYMKCQMSTIEAVLPAPDIQHREKLLLDKMRVAYTT